jgi:hypothetical protein
MKSTFVVLSLLASLSQVSKAATLTFDDVPGGSFAGAWGNMPAYKGFVFSSTLNWIDIVTNNGYFGAKSGDFAVLNNYGGVGVVTKQGGGEFTFDGLWAKMWLTPPESGNSDFLPGGVLEGYNQGNLVWGVSTTLNGSYQYFGGEAGAIDELHLGFGNAFLADDIVLNEVSAVPEIQSYAMVLAGLAVIGFFLGRRLPA